LVINPVWRDALIERHGENEFLALLDGEAQVDNIVFLSSTNYPERLDRRFVDRPSRFDTIKYIGMPSAGARHLFLNAKEPSLTPEELDLWVERTEGFSIAHLKELIIAVRCFRQPFAEALDGLSKCTNGNRLQKIRPIGNSE
jgi:SpoVK/Ycf46/Vps4 family AAA+-type ATPase